jgi:hypothetical protein
MVIGFQLQQPCCAEDYRGELAWLIEIRLAAADAAQWGLGFHRLTPRPRCPVNLAILHWHRASDSARQKSDESFLGNAVT